MKIANKFWWLVFLFIFFTLTVLVILAMLLWQDLSPAEHRFLAALFKSHFGYFFGGGFVVLAAIGFALDGIYRSHILPVHRLSEETRIIHAVNPSHRIRIEGARSIIELAQAINDGANQYEALHRSVEEKVQAARNELEEEKNILAAIMAELPEGVLICNADGRILLYNRRAGRFLSASGNHGGLVGLGRSVFGVVNRGLLGHALDEIAYRLDRNEPNVAAYFVAAGHDGRLLRVETVPILGASRRFTGFVLIVQDITRQLETDSRLDTMIRTLTNGMRASLASIRTAIEAVLEYPDMTHDHHLQFRQIIHNETLTLTRILEKSLSDTTSEPPPAGWPLTVMPVQDLLTPLKRSVENKLGITLEMEPVAEPVWIRTDTVSMIFTLQLILWQIQKETGSTHFFLSIKQKGKVANIDFSWQGAVLEMDTLKTWYPKRFAAEAQPMPLTLGQVLAHHGAEIWTPTELPAGRRPYLRLFLPVAAAREPEPSRTATILPQSRPEFYDFDLFNQPGQVPEIDNLPLAELTCTVFDTETTGLNPRGGDEIISIGAIRIVNGQLLHKEVFDQLVDPRRDLPWESIKIHGIQPEMLRGQPVIEQVLPLFHRFASDTVLVGHNIAFDMRMIQMKEEITGIRIENPMLDTMLLSAVVHPAHNDHAIEAMADRLGIRVLGRHTALGDAMATGELFLALLPLLEKMGIRTLREARVASQKTYYARIKY